MSGFTPRTLSLSGEERALSRLRSLTENSPLIGGKGANCDCMLGPSFDPKISWSLGRKSSGQKDRNYLLQNRAVIDLGVCLGVKALFQPLPPCFDPDLWNSPHGVSSRQFNFEPLETLSTHHIIEPVKDALYGTI